MPRRYAARIRSGERSPPAASSPLGSSRADSSGGNGLSRRSQVIMRETYPSRPDNLHGPSNDPLVARQLRHFRARFVSFRARPANGRRQIVGDPIESTIIEFWDRSRSNFLDQPGYDRERCILHERHNTAASVGVIDRSGKIAASVAPVAQWIEQPPPKGQVARSIRVRGATIQLLSAREK